MDTFSSLLSVTWSKRSNRTTCRIKYIIAVEMTSCHVNVKKVKESRNRPGVAQRVPGGSDSQISMTSAHESGEVVSLTHRPPLPPGNVPGTHFH
jgi:hypothetical protein